MYVCGCNVVGVARERERGGKSEGGMARLAAEQEKSLKTGGK